MAQITVPAKISRLEEVQDFVGGILREADVSIKLQNDIAAIVDEIFVNIATHAYQPGEGDATVCVLIEKDEVVLEFQDSGIPFDPLGLKEPDLTLPAGERQIGGLGIYLVKQSVDDATYYYEEGMNCLRLTKKRENDDEE